MTVRIKIIAFLIFVLMILGTTAAHSYYTDREYLLNKASNGMSDIKIKEEFKPTISTIIPAGSKVKKVIQIENLKAESFVRCYIAFSDSRYEDATSIDFNTADWEKSGDYWYYKKILKTGETTTPIMTEVLFKQSVPNGFDIIVNAESVYAEGAVDCKTAFSKIN